MSILTFRVFSGTRLELVTRQATIRYVYHSATAATSYDRTEYGGNSNKFEIFILNVNTRESSLRKVASNITNLKDEDYPINRKLNEKGKRL
ncbi:hypothetical protein TNCV_4547721 [Trichonephila clavipes]|nr:hypothetical protein TNCV_4547721 [Trichonephila clavipes]